MTGFFRIGLLPSLLVSLLAVSSLLTGCATSSGGSHGSTQSAEQVETPEAQAERLFEVLDVNGDGKVSREEAKNGFQYLIASYDRGGRVEILAAKSGSTESTSKKKASKRRPTQQDATRAFEAMFESPTKVGNGITTAGISQEEFKKLVVKASDNPEADPFAAFF